MQHVAITHKALKTPPLIRFHLRDSKCKDGAADTVLTIYCTVYSAAGKGEEMTLVVVSWLISGALTHNETKLSLILQHGNPHRNPLQQPTGAPRTLGVMGRRWERLLTSVDWGEGWSRSLTPVSPFSHSTISPPERHSRSGRLPAALAPSPSRTQVCNDGVIEIQQISHISLLFSFPLTPSFTVWCR